jgi:hypothetical protein
MENNLLRRGAPEVTEKSLRILLCVAALVLLFSLYTWGISQNPPGFYLDVQPHVRCEWQTVPRISYITLGTTH